MMFRASHMTRDLSHMTRDLSHMTRDLIESHKLSAHIIHTK